MFEHPYLVGDHTIHFNHYLDANGEDIYLDRFYIGDKITGEVEGFDNIEDLNQFGMYDSEYHEKYLLKAKLANLYKSDTEYYLFSLGIRDITNNYLNKSPGVFSRLFDLSNQQYDIDSDDYSCYLTVHAIAKKEKIVFTIYATIDVYSDGELVAFTSNDTGYMIRARLFLEHEIISKIFNFTNNEDYDGAYKELLKYEPNVINLILDRVFGGLIPGISLDITDYDVSPCFIDYWGVRK